MMNPSTIARRDARSLSGLLLWSMLILAALALGGCRGSAPAPPPPPEPEPDPLAPLSQSARLYYDNSGG
ncbi:MAG: hypothetical protein EA422_00240, partial [Gemmatimonadales bacterium]